MPPKELREAYQNPTFRPSVTNRVSAITQTLEANFMKIYRKIEHNKKVCRAQNLGSYAQGHGHNQARGLNRVSAITRNLLKQI